MTVDRSKRWKPKADAAIARQRAKMMQRARHFFDERSVLEVDTPILCDAAVSDPNIESIAVKLALAPGETFYLQTSPEFHMKRLLAAGFPDIFEISKVFRDAELGYCHQPEFTMIEWYRLGFGLDEMVEETVEFIEAVIGPSILSKPAERMTYCDTFIRFTDINPLIPDINKIKILVGADDDLTMSLGESDEAWLDLLMLQQIAPKLAMDRLTVIDHYPAAQAALAQLCPEDDTVADRFEVFLGSLELANGYVELTDSAEQLRRCNMDQEKRKMRNSPLRPTDKKFMAALEHGLPGCAGVAVGFDRLQMISERSSDISSVRHFPMDAD